MNSGKSYKKITQVCTTVSDQRKKKYILFILSSLSSGKMNGSIQLMSLFYLLLIQWECKDILSSMTWIQCAMAEEEMEIERNGEKGT